MLKPKKVQAPEGCEQWITPRRVYDVTRCDDSGDEESGYGFFIVSDLGSEIYCLERHCAHLNGGDWVIIETE
jgi:hypothetical protein